MRADPAPTYGRRCSGLGSVTCTLASLPVSGTQLPSWSTWFCRTGPVPRLFRLPIVIESWMSGTFSLEASHLPEARTISAVRDLKTARTADVIHCDLNH